VLVVACPCALGIATPMATTIALSLAIGRGCLVRSGAVLEALSRIRAMAFDKTGTSHWAERRWSTTGPRRAQPPVSRRVSGSRPA